MLYDVMYPLLRDNSPTVVADRLRYTTADREATRARAAPHTASPRAM